MLSPSERTLRARMAAHAMHAAGRTNTRAAVDAVLAKFEAQVDPEGALAPDERRRRAIHARKAHMARLAFESAKKRRKAAP